MPEKSNRDIAACALVLLLMTGIAVACTGSGDTEGVVAQEPEIRLIGDALWPTGFGASVQSLNEAYPLVFVAEVVGYRNVDFVLPTPLSGPGQGEPPPPKGFVYSELRIAEVVRGEGLKPGDTVELSQTGTRIRDRTGKVIEYQLERAPLVREGETYLFFAHVFEGREGLVVAAPFGIFRIDAAAGTIHAHERSWSRLGAVEALDGLSLSEARSKIALQAPR